MVRPGSNTETACKKVTIFTKRFLFHVLTNISGYICLILKKSVTKLEPFKFESYERKVNLYFITHNCYEWHFIRQGMTEIRLQHTMTILIL